MRGVLLVACVCAVAGCGDSEEKKLRAEYARYLDVKKEADKLVEERKKDRRVAVEKLDAERREVRRTGELDKESAINAKLADLMTNPPPHPLDGQINNLRNQAKEIRDANENKWKSLGLDVE